MPLTTVICHEVMHTHHDQKLFIERFRYSDESNVLQYFDNV